MSAGMCPSLASRRMSSSSCRVPGPCRSRRSGWRCRPGADARVSASGPGSCPAPTPPAASGSGRVSSPAWGNRGPREAGRRTTPGVPARISRSGLFSAVPHWPSSLTLPPPSFRAVGAVLSPAVSCERSAAVGAPPDPVPVGVLRTLGLSLGFRGRTGAGLPGIPAGLQEDHLVHQLLLVPGRPGEVLHGAGQASPVE